MRDKKLLSLFSKNSPNKKNTEKEAKPYKEDFFSNFETYHVAEDYAEDIIAYLKERDVLFSTFQINYFRYQCKSKIVSQNTTFLQTLEVK